MKNITFLIPVYNDWESFSKLLDEINKILKDVKNFSFNLIVVNDGSNSKYTKKNIPDFLKKIIQGFKVEKKYRVSVRGSTKDRMPFFCSLNSVLSKNTKNEYLLGGMGSWGFVYAPLYAEFLIKSLLSEPLVINSNLERLLGVNRLL